MLCGPNPNESILIDLACIEFRFDSGGLWPRSNLRVVVRSMSKNVGRIRVRRLGVDIVEYVLAP